MTSLATQPVTSPERTKNNVKWVEEREASAKVVTGTRPVLVIGTEEIRDGMDDAVLEQVKIVVGAPGIDKLILGPDFHLGYGTPVGSVFSSRTHIYPCAVGPDIACSMALSSFGLDAEELRPKEIRRKLINAIGQRIPSGAGAKQAPKGRKLTKNQLLNIAIYGASSKLTLEEGGIDPSWADMRLEDTHRGDPDRLRSRMTHLMNKWGSDALYTKLSQVGSLGSGNHFASGDIAEVDPAMSLQAKIMGLETGQFTMLTHCGSRGFGFNLTSGRNKFDGHFESLKRFFQTWSIPFPGGDDHMVYCPVGTQEAADYLDDMSLGANFAIYNHLLLHTLVKEAVHEVFGTSIKCQWVYHIAHNIIREEIDPDTNRPTYVHRKGATRAFLGFHHDTNDLWKGMGHPILLPGNCEVGSVVMVGMEGSQQTLYSVNHGAGRAMGRKEAFRKLNQEEIDKRMADMDVLYNTRKYPLDEAGPAYKNFDTVIDSVVKANLAKTVARLKPMFVFKDNDKDPEGAA